MSNIKVACGAFGTIYAGTVTKTGLWGKNKTDVTMETLEAVVKHALLFGKPIELSKEGKVEFRITVEDLR